MFGAFQFGEPYFGEGPGAVAAVVGPSELDFVGAAHQTIESDGATHVDIALAGGLTTIELEGSRH